MMKLDKSYPVVLIRILEFITYYIVGTKLKPRAKNKNEMVKHISSAVRLFGLESWLNIYYRCDT